MTDVEDLREAARLMTERATAAMDWPEERWMPGQGDSGLGVGCYMPGDVLDDGSVLWSYVAYFAYPDDTDRPAHARALPAAAHMAGFDPAVALAVASWLSAHADDLDRAAGDVGWCHSPGDTQRAVQVARTYLRKDTES